MNHLTFLILLLLPFSAHASLGYSDLFATAPVVHELAKLRVETESASASGKTALARLLYADLKYRFAEANKIGVDLHRYEDLLDVYRLRIENTDQQDARRIREQRISERELRGWVKRNFFEIEYGLSSTFFALHESKIVYLSTRSELIIHEELIRC